MKYEVLIKETEKYSLRVLANSEDDAINKAYEMLEESKDRYHDDSDGEAEAFEIS